MIAVAVRAVQLGLFGSERRVHSWKTGSFYEYIRSHMHYEGNGKVPARHPWCTEETGRIPRFGVHEEVFMTVTGKTGKKVNRFVRDSNVSFGCRM